MGLRQPSKTATFFAQAGAGAQRQKEAREKLKTNQALGGSAGVGTQMVAATTEAQKAATAKVGTAGEAAAKDIVAKNVGGQTAAAIAGTPTTSGVASVYTPPKLTTVASGETGDVAAVEASGKAVENEINTITSQINDLNTQLANANALEAKSINDEKTRLSELLKSYQDKLEKEKLGQIAGPSSFETEMATREQILADEGQDVAKLAAIFGPRWNAQRYGALASQIYGKDLEAIQEKAAAGLQEREESKLGTESALKQYSQQLSASKKAYEEKLDADSKKLELLKKSPQELTAYTRKEMEDLFGKDTAEKLFDFASSDPTATVTKTEASKTKQTLEEALKTQQSEQLKIAGETTKAQTKKEEIFKTAEANIFGDVNRKGGVDVFKEQASRIIDNAQRIVGEIENITSSMFRKEWGGISRDSWTANEVRKKAYELKSTLNRKSKEIEEARKNKDTAKMQSLYEEYANYARETNKEITALWNQMSENARRL
jgi:hypothetical protein